MRDWLSASDLADLGLPGLPTDKSAWTRYAEREGWLTRKDNNGQPLARVVKGRGGERIEYHIDLLPAVTLAMYVSEHVGKVDIDRSDAVAAAENLQPATIAALEQRDARLTLVAAAERLARDANLSQVVADKLFAGLYRLGKIEVAPWVRASVKKVSVSSLSRWRKHRRYGDLHRLGVDKGVGRRGKGKLALGEEGKVAAFLLAEIARKPEISGRKLHNLLIAHFPNLGDVSQRTVERMAAELRAKNKVALTALTNPDRFKSHYRVAGENVAAHVCRINQLWEIDASPADVLTIDGRYNIYCCIDVFTRRMIILVSKTPRAEAVGMLTRKAIAEWGVPEIIKTDNGSDFIARFTKHLFNALGIEVETCPPFSPEKKPHVERAIQTFQHDFCQDLPGFVGHSVADRKKIEERRAFAQRLGQDDAGAFKVQLTAQELQTRADAWAKDDYGTRAHSSIGMSPFAKAAAFDGVVRRLEDPRALNVLLAPIAKGDGTRTVTKRGVRIDHRYYLTQEMPETRVFVRMDPADLGRIWLFSEDGLTFLGEAICPEVAGVDPAAAVIEMRLYQKRAIAEIVEPIRKEMNKRSQLDIADIQARIAADRAGKLIEFPKKTETYSTPALEAAGEAARTGEDELREMLRKDLEATEASVASKCAEIEGDLVGLQGATPDNVQPLRKGSTPQQRMARARSIDRRTYLREQVSDAELVWLAGYRREPEFITMLDDMKERFRHARFLQREKDMNAPVWPHELSWLKGYVGGSEYAAMSEIFDDFGEEGVR